jgi:hypothetical protein
LATRSAHSSPGRASWRGATRPATTAGRPTLGRQAQRQAEALDMPLLVADAMAFNTALTGAR